MPLLATAAATVSGSWQYGKLEQPPAVTWHSSWDEQGIASGGGAPCGWIIKCRSHRSLHGFETMLSPDPHVQSVGGRGEGGGFRGRSDLSGHFG